jgi:hypothetical protein
MKQALGLAVSGTEVRLAHLVSHNGQIRIEGLERARLKTTLENQPQDNDKAKADDQEAKDAFGLKEAFGEKAAGDNERKADTGNLEILYRLLEKYTKKKTKIAFNIPLSMVTYQRQDAAERTGGTDKDAESNLGQERITANDGATLVVSYEKHPPTMSLMREVNEFLRGNLFLALMDPTEVALANLARRSNELEAGKITAIVYIEDDFTRLIFLRGSDLFHVSSIIHENAASPDILEVIYRKLIYEQDEAGIPEIAAIWLAGKSNRINAAEFFAAHFESVDVRYLSASTAGGLSPSEGHRGMFSEFAVPIALAWKTLEPKSPFFIPTNLLPQDLLDQQQVLKLSYHGYALLALTGLVAFFITWQIIKLNGNIREMRAKNTQLEMKISSNQSTVDRVMQLDNQCTRLRKNFQLADSLSRGHDEFLAFLQRLNASVARAGSVWVDEIVKHADGFSVKGTSLSRDAIPLLAEKLENASLSQVTRVESTKRKAFGFSLERRSAPDQVQLSKQGISTIDAARYASNGNLIIGKDGTAVQPIIRPAASTPSAKDEAWPNMGNRLAAAAPATANRQPDLPAPAEPLKAENKTAKPADGIARPVSQEITGSSSTENLGPQAPVPSSINPTNGSAASSKQVSNGEGKSSAVQTLQPTPEAAKPAMPPAEIYRGYTIEAATSFTKELAEQFAMAYRKQGYDAAVEYYKDERSGTNKYRVLLGAFATRPAAEKQAAQMAGLLMKDYRVVGLK